MIQQAKRSLAERHIQVFLEAMSHLGFQREEILALLDQEMKEEGETHASA